MHGTDLSKKAKAVLKDYVSGNLTASGAAYVLWHDQLTPVPDPSASEVIVWSRECGFGIPIPPESEVVEQVKRAMEMLNRSR